MFLSFPIPNIDYLAGNLLSHTRYGMSTDFLLQNDFTRHFFTHAKIMPENCKIVSKNTPEMAIISSDILVMLYPLGYTI
jgi:hypothetical protein